jgi:hypothetical protein
MALVVYTSPEEFKFSVMVKAATPRTFSIDARPQHTAASNNDPAAWESRHVAIMRFGSTMMAGCPMWHHIQGCPLQCPERLRVARIAWEQRRLMWINADVIWRHRPYFTSTDARYLTTLGPGVRAADGLDSQNSVVQIPSHHESVAPSQNSGDVISAYDQALLRRISGYDDDVDDDDDGDMPELVQPNTPLTQNGL